MKRTILTAFIALAILPLGGCCSSMHDLVDPTTVVAPREESKYSREWLDLPVDQVALIWKDPARDREVPVRMYIPRRSGARLPIVIFSHGIGESRDSYDYIGKAWAARGYVTVHITHHGTDREVLDRGWLALYRATKQPENWKNRPLDVSFVIDRLGGPLTDVPSLAGRLDMTRIAVAGHSAGAYTALASGGMIVDGHSFRDPRVKAVIAMSMPKINGIVDASSYASIAVPVLNMTGTCDGSLIYRTKAADRREPFLDARGPDQYLVTFEKVNHNVFSDPQTSANANVHEEITAIGGVFLDAFLLGDPYAKSWLSSGGLSAWGRGKFVVEKK